MSEENNSTKLNQIDIVGVGLTRSGVMAVEVVVGAVGAAGGLELESTVRGRVTCI